jgi:hypothetical protein
MITIVFLCIMLGPQLVDGMRSVEPATHLTLLLFSMSIVTACLSAMALHTLSAPQSSTGVPYDVAHLNALAYATIGLALLTPFYWTVEHFSPNGDLRIDAILAQTLAIAFTAAILGQAPHLIELATLALTIALAAQALRSLRAPLLQK